MDRRFDIDPGDDDDDFEKTHTEIAAYVRENRQMDANTKRLIWEAKVMRRVKKLERAFVEFANREKDTVQIAAIAQAELRPYLPIRKFWTFCITWRNRILKWGLGTVVTVGVTWWLAKHGIK